jgi:hypothetical protein
MLLPSLSFLLPACCSVCRCSPLFLIFVYTATQYSFASVFELHSRLFQPQSPKKLNHFKPYSRRYLQITRVGVVRWITPAAAAAAAPAAAAAV